MIDMTRYLQEHINREYNRFANPHGLQVRVGTGMGAGWQIATLGKPPPVARVYRFLTNKIMCAIPLM